MHFSLSETTLRTALVNHRADLIRLSVLRPSTFKDTNDRTIAEIDAVLLGIAGNVNRVSVTPFSCSIAP